MGAMDLFAIFDDKTSFIHAAGTYTSLSSYDTGAAGSPQAIPPPYPTVNAAAAGPGIGGPLLHDIGRGLKFSIVSQITTTCVGAAATVQAQFVCDIDYTLNNTPQILLQTDLISVNALVAGYRFPFGSIPDKVPKQFIGMRYVISIGLTAGVISSYLTLLHSTGDHGDYIGA